MRETIANGLRGLADRIAPSGDSSRLVAERDGTSVSDTGEIDTDTFATLAQQFHGFSADECEQWEDDVCEASSGETIATETAREIMFSYGVTSEHTQNEMLRGLPNTDG